jgi:hypothetical protein
MRIRFTRRRAAALAGAALTATAVLAVTGGATAALVLNNGTPNPFHLAKVGPVNQLDGLPAGDPLHDPTANGFPYWYSDGTNTLELCLDPPTAAGDNCALTGVIPNPAAPVTFPQVQDDPTANFPGEAFYWMGTGGGAIGTGANAGKSLVVMALEGAFVNAVPEPGDQMVFARTRMRIDIPDTAGQYTVVWPYGEKTFDAQPGKRTINVTQDVGLTPGEFSQALAGNIGPFLRWDSSPPAAPDGFLGDAVTLHGVTGSPFVYQGRAANFVRIEGPAGAVLRNAGDPNPCPDRPADTNCIEYPQFTILGKKAVRAGVEGTRAVYTRKGATTTVDLFGTSGPGAHLQVKGATIPSTDLDADAASGFYFSRLAQPTATFDPADVLTLRNLTDQPNTRSIVRLTDGVVIDDATYYNSAAAGHARGDLVITAHTTDDQNTDPLTVVGVGELPAAGAADAPRTGTFADDPASPGIAAPPATIRVTSTHGGAASVAVQIAGAVTPPAPTAAVITVAGATGAAGHAAMLNTLTLGGASSSGDYGAWRWSIGTPTSAAAGFDAAAHTPTLSSGSLTGVVDSALPLAQQVVQPIAVHLPGASTPAQNVAHDVSFTLTLYPDQASMQAGTGAITSTTQVIHVDPAVTAAARLAAVVATPQRTAVTLDASASTGTGAFAWEQLDPETALPAAGDQAGLKALPPIAATASTRITKALGTGPTATFTMPDTTAFEDDFPFANRAGWHLRFRVRAKSALGASADSVAVVDIAFKADALTGVTGKFDANKNQLRIRGNAAVFGVTNTLRVYAGARAADFDDNGDYKGAAPAPALLGSQLVLADGTFDARLTLADPALPAGAVTLVTTAGAVQQNQPAGAIVAIPLAATRVVAAVSRKVAAPAGRVKVRLVIKARAKRGNKCTLRTTKKALQRKLCGATQTVFNITVKRRTVVFVQITGKRQKTVTTRRIRL